MIQTLTVSNHLIKSHEFPCTGAATHMEQVSELTFSDFRPQITKVGLFPPQNHRAASECFRILIQLPWLFPGEHSPSYSSFTGVSMKTENHMLSLALFVRRDFVLKQTRWALTQGMRWFTHIRKHSIKTTSCHAREHRLEHPCCLLGVWPWTSWLAFFSSYVLISAAK